MATYDGSGIFHLLVEAETEVDARNKIELILTTRGISHHIIEIAEARRDTDGSNRQGSQHKTG